MSMMATIYSFLIKTNLEAISIFCRVNGTPRFGHLVTSALGLKTRVDSLAMYLCTSIGRARVQDQACCCLSQNIRSTTELRQLRTATILLTKHPTGRTLSSD